MPTSTMTKKRTKKTTKKKTNSASPNYYFLSGTQQNINIALNIKQWAYTKAKKCKQYKISPGDFVFLIANKVVYGVGIVLTKPDKSVTCTGNPWSGTYYHPFDFEVIKQGSLSIAKAKKLVKGEIKPMNNVHTPHPLTKGDMAEIIKAL